MRKFLVLVVAVSLLIIPLTAFAKNEETGLDIEAKAAILVDASSGTVMFEKEADTPLPIASVTKVMTLNLIFEAVENGMLSLTENITVSEAAAGMGGSQAFIDAGFDYTAEELIKSIIIASANDAAVAMAERISGSEDAFVVKMNNKAKALEMNNTVFKNCTGLPEDGHFSTARDVAKMSAELLRHEDYFKWGTVWMDQIKHAKDGRVTELVNTNKLIRTLNGCDGLKTGSTSEARFCISTTAKRGDMRLVSVVLGGSTSKERFSDAAELINYGFANYSTHSVVNAGDHIGEVPLVGGVEKSVGAIALNGFSICINNDGTDTVETKAELFENVNAPVQHGDSLGKMTVYLNGDAVGTIELVADNHYKKAGFFDRLKGIISFWN